MNSQTISLRVGYSDTKITFHLKVVSIEEENLYTQRFTDIVESGERKAQKVYEVIVDALANWSTKMPTVSAINGTESPLGEGTPAEAVQKYFAERTNEKERIANAAMVSFRDRMTPSVDFL